MINFIKKKINIKLKSTFISVKGPLGTLSKKLPVSVKFLQNNSYFVEKNHLFAFKQFIYNVLYSISYGWFYELFITGKGFKLFFYKKFLAFDLGYSSLFLYKNTVDRIKLLNIQQKIILFSTHKQEVSNLIAELKKFYFKDQYQGRGVFFKEEKIKIKKVKKI